MIRFENVLMTSSKRLEDILKMFWRCLENVFKISWRRFCKTSWRRIGKTSWWRLEDVRPRQLYWSWSKRLEDVFKSPLEHVWVRRIWVRLIYTSEDEDERRIQDVLIKTNVCRVICFDSSFGSQDFHYLLLAFLYLLQM